MGKEDLLHQQTQRPPWRDLAGAATSAAVPLVSMAAIAAVEPGWLSNPSPAVRTATVACLLLVQAGVAALWAPLMGLFAASRVQVLLAVHPRQGPLVWPHSGAWMLAWRMMLSATVATASSAALALAWQSSFDATAVLRSHAMLWAIVLTFGALGAASAAWLAQRLDAAATAIGAAVTTVMAVFATGPVLDGIPQPVLDAALVANPVVAIAVGANLDLFRMSLFYQLSPLAHRQVDYPAAALVFTAYALTAGVMILVAAGRLDRRSPTLTMQRMVP